MDQSKKKPWLRTLLFIATQSLSAILALSAILFASWSEGYRSTFLLLTVVAIWLVCFLLGVKIFRLHFSKKRLLIFCLGVFILSGATHFFDKRAFEARVFEEAFKIPPSEGTQILKIRKINWIDRELLIDVRLPDSEDLTKLVSLEDYEELPRDKPESGILRFYPEGVSNSEIKPKFYQALESKGVTTLTWLESEGRLIFYRRE